MNLINRQATIKKKVSISGVTLHSGENCEIELNPLPVNSGIFFNGVNLSPLNVYGTAGMTMLGKLNQIEHLCSCLYSFGIDNLNIKTTKNEMPILDGCSRIFCDLIISSGIKYYEESKKKLIINEEIVIKDGDSYIKFIPTDNDYTEFECYVDFPYTGKQEYKWSSLEFEKYYNEISNAKTFFWDKQIENEYKLDRCKGIKKNQNSIIYGPTDKFNNSELARHKLLDLIGDLSTINVRIPGKFIGYKCGHTINNKMINKIFNEYYNKLEIKFPIRYFKFNENIDLDEVKEKTCECIDNRQFINSKYVSEFESNAKDFIGCKHILSTNSGTTALQLCIMALELPKNSIIAIPNLTFWATYEAVKLCGHRALVIDTDDNFQIDYNLLKEAINNNNVSAVMIVHLYGYVSDNYSDIAKLCSDNNIYLLEDGSHALGSKYENEYIFRRSVLAGISLYPTKILGSNGNAGIVVTNDDELAKKVVIYRDNGRIDTRYDHYKIGGNFIMNSIQAIYSNSYLLNFETTLNNLFFKSEAYRINFNDLKTMRYLDVKKCDPNGYMAILVCERNNFNFVFRELKRRNIDVCSIYSSTIANQKGFDDKEDITLLNSKSDKLCKSVINLPIYYNLTPFEQKYIIETVKEVDKINTMIVGMGRMGKFHIKELKEDTNYNVIGYIDPFVEEYDNLKKIKSYIEAKEIGINMVFISSSTIYHKECIEECISNNMNFIVEKPALISYEEHEVINKKVSNSCIFGLVGLTERYNKCFEKFDFKQKINKINVTRYCRIPNDGNTSNLFFDLVIHDIDLIQYHFQNEFFVNQVKKVENEVFIEGTINNIDVNLNIGYSNEKSKRAYEFEIDSNEVISINLISKDSLLKFEHDDIINYLKKKKNKLCSLEESLRLTKKIEEIINF